MLESGDFVRSTFSLQEKSSLLQRETDNTSPKKLKNTVRKNRKFLKHPTNYGLNFEVLSNFSMFVSSYIFPAWFSA